MGLRWRPWCRYRHARRSDARPFWSGIAANWTDVPGGGDSLSRFARETSRCASSASARAGSPGSGPGGPARCAREAPPPKAVRARLEPHPAARSTAAAPRAPSALPRAARRAERVAPALRAGPGVPFRRPPRPARRRGSPGPLAARPRPRRRRSARTASSTGTVTTRPPAAAATNTTSRTTPPVAASTATRVGGALRRVALEQRGGVGVAVGLVVDDHPLPAVAVQQVDGAADHDAVEKGADGQLAIDLGARGGGAYGRGRPADVRELGGSFGKVGPAQVGGDRRRERRERRVVGEVAQLHDAVHGGAERERPGTAGRRARSPGSHLVVDVLEPARAGRRRGAAGALEECGALGAPARRARPAARSRRASRRGRRAARPRREAARAGRRSRVSSVGGCSPGRRQSAGEAAEQHAGGRLAVLVRQLAEAAHDQAVAGPRRGDVEQAAQLARGHLLLALVERRVRRRAPGRMRRRRATRP